MNAARRSLVGRIICALVFLAVAAGPAAAGAAKRDAPFRSPRLDSHPLTTVAVLPAVAVAADPDVEAFVAEMWVALYADASTAWLPAEQVSARLAAAAGESPELLGEVRGQIWRRGEVEAALAGRLAEGLGVDAVLSLRIDRWEIVDGGRAQVGMSAVLTHADGTRLWSISGLAGHGRSPGSAEQPFNMDLSWIRCPRLEPQTGPRRLDRALYTLLARWAWELPAGPLYADEASGAGRPAPIRTN